MRRERFRVDRLGSGAAEGEWLTLLDDCEARLAINPAEVSLEPPAYRNDEQLRHLVRVQFLERPFETVNRSGARLEEDNDLGFVGELVFPAIKGAGAGHHCSAGDEPAVK